VQGNAIVTPDTKKTAILADEVSILPRALFIHCPKTGGTTLNSILAGNYATYPMVSNLRFGSDASVFGEINRVENRYVAGHFPVSIANLNAFDEKITILRNPLDLVCSTISFVDQIIDDHPRVASALETGSKLEIYREYFSTHFEFGRFQIEEPYGLASDFFQYAEECQAEDAAEILKGFNRILSFDQLDAEIKNVILDCGFFPYSIIPRKRSYSYQPDYETGRRLLSDFDEKFYSLMQSRFTNRLEGIDARYELYKIHYCANKGISLDLFQGKQIDFHKPFGLGWHSAELSELGKLFVWSDSVAPTIELPIANAGTYMFYMYIDSNRAKGMTVQITTLIGRRSFPVNVFEREGISVYQCCISMQSADWINANLEIDLDSDRIALLDGHSSLDERARGMILGDVYIKRVQPI
jgi:hypothetical protein